MRLILASAMGLALVLPGGVIAQEAAGKLTWTPTLEAGLAAAKEKKAPIVIVVVAGEEADRKALLAAHADPAVVALLAKTVNVVAVEGSHGGDATSPCPLFPGVTCAQHQTAWREVTDKQVKSQRIVPQHLFLAPGGKLLLKRGYELAGEELAKRINQAIGLVDRAAEDKTLAEKVKFTLDVLVSRIRDPEPEGRKSAAGVLGESDVPSALLAVRQALATTNDEETRGGIYEGLGKRGNWSALGQVLVPGLGDKANLVRVAVLDAIEKVDMPDAVPDLLSHLGREGSVLALGMTVKTACYLDWLDAKVVSAALGHSAHARVTVRICSAWGLSKMQGNTKVLARLRQMLTSDNEVNGRAAAAWALGKVGEASDAEAIATQVAKEPPEPAMPREVMAAGIEAIRGTVRGDYEELIRRLLVTEAAADEGGSGKGKGGWGKWGNPGGTGGIPPGAGGGKGGKGGGWGGKGGKGR